MPLKLNSTGGGSVTVDVPNTASTFTATLPARTGTVITSADSATVTQSMLATNVAGNGPAFSVYRSTNQTGVSGNTFTKIQFDTEEFDTNSNYDNTTNYRFTPTVAGYYQFNACFQVSASGVALISFYKNGTRVKEGNIIATGAAGGPNVTASALIYCNGSTDYVEAYGYNINATSFVGGQSFTYFQGFLARSA